MNINKHRRLCLLDIWLIMIKRNISMVKHECYLEANISKHNSSIGRVFRPHCGGGARWRPFRFRPPSWMTSFPEPGMRSSKMAAGSGRAAIMRHRHNGVQKTRPRSWLTSFLAPPSWIQAGGTTSNVWRTSGLPWRRPILIKGWS